MTSTFVQIRRLGVSALFAIALGLLAAGSLARADRLADARAAGSSSDATLVAEKGDLTHGTAPGGPSFDCSKAHSQSEQLICSDVELSRLDRRFATIYAQALSKASDKAEFRRESRERWKVRESTCKDAACLRTWYESRTAELSAVVGILGPQDVAKSNSARDCIARTGSPGSCAHPPATRPAHVCSMDGPSDLACTADEMAIVEKNYRDHHLSWLYLNDVNARFAAVYSLNEYVFAPLNALNALNARRVALDVAIINNQFTTVSISADAFTFPGRLACTAPDCPLSVRFDQGPLRTYSTIDPNGVSMQVVNPDSFLSELRKAKTANIVFPLVGEGNVVFVFNVAGFKW